MRKNTVRDKLTEFLTIPSDIRAEYWQDTLKKNRFSLLVICFIIFGTELFNIARVLFWSKSKLGTLNNRIYFGMYCALVVSAVLCLLLMRLLRNRSPRAEWLVQYGSVLFFFLWHICLNAYDLIQDSSAGVTLYITAVMGLAVFIQMPHLYSLLCFFPGYILFMVLAGPMMDLGAQINLTITSIVALALSLTNCHHTVIQICQRIEINRINTKLHRLLQEDPLTGLLNKKAFRQRVEHRVNQAQSASLALCIIDVDNFKAINDRYGHPCGDYVLVEISQRLRAVFQQVEDIGRIGGDEFAVLLSGDAAQDDWTELGQSLIKAVGEILWRGQRVGASCSVGICHSCLADLSYEQFYEAADRALYDAKSAGKQRCRCIALASSHAK